jgi:putative oxidoreductase
VRHRDPGLLAPRLLMASVFVVMGAYRLWGAWQGAPTAGSTLTFSAVELVLGLLIASGWKLRVTASLAAVLMLADAFLSHRFWSLSGAAQGAQLLHFMKNVGFVGGLVLLAMAAVPRRRH